MHLANILEIILPISLFTYCLISTRNVFISFAAFKKVQEIKGTTTFGRLSCINRFLTRAKLYKRYVNHCLPFFDTLVQFSVMFGIYEIVRVIVARLYPDSSTAFNNATGLVNLQEYLGLGNIEYEWQSMSLEYEWIIFVSNHFYKQSHWTGVGIFITYFYKNQREYFSFIKQWFIISNIIAFIIFALFPMAPPRMIKELGIIDTLRLSNDYSSTMLDSPLVNHFAAMPSMHFGYSFLFSFAFLFITRVHSLKCVVKESAIYDALGSDIPLSIDGYDKQSLVSKGMIYLPVDDSVNEYCDTDKFCTNLVELLQFIFIISYPIMMLFSIVITGNHFVLDAIVGATVVVFSLIIVNNIHKLLFFISYTHSDIKHTRVGQSLSYYSHYLKTRLPAPFLYRYKETQNDYSDYD